MVTKMERRIKELKNSRVEVTAEVSSHRLAEARSKALDEFREKVETPGFRKGRAPDEAVAEVTGEERLLTRAAELVVSDGYREILEEEGLEPITQPKVEIIKLAPGNPFRFKMTFTVLPTADLPDYRKIASKVEKGEVEVSGEEVQETLDWLKKSRPELSKVLRPAQEGDFIEIEFSSPQIQGGRSFEDGFILGQGKLVPGFKEHLLGMAEGEEKEFTLDLPDEFRIKEAAGQKARFQIRVKGVKETAERTVDDEFAKELGEFEDLAQLKQNIREGLRGEKEKAAQKKRRQDILEKIVEKTDLKVPEVLIERDVSSQLKGLKDRVAKEMKMTFEEYLERVKRTEEELMEGLRESAQQRAERFLVLKEISKREGIEPTEAEVRKEVERTLARYPDPEKAREEIDPRELEGYTKEGLRNEQTLRFLEEL